MRTRVAAAVALMVLCSIGLTRAEDRVGSDSIVHATAATYINGTVKAVSENTAGAFDTASPSALELRFGGAQVSIPYMNIKSCAYREENKFRLGVLATIAVGLVKARTKNHFVTITWEDGGASQVMTLETPKRKAVGLVEVIRARAPEACKPRAGGAAACFVP